MKPGDDPEEWFRERGFGVELEADDMGGFWVHLTRLPTGQIVAPRYGRGDTPLDAVLRARQRYEVEQ